MMNNLNFLVRYEATYNAKNPKGKFSYFALLFVLQFAIGCTNGNPIISSLGIFDQKLGPISFKVPVGDVVQVTSFSQGFVLEGYCDKSVLGIEFSSDGKNFTRLNSSEVESKINCSNQGLFTSKILNIGMMAQTLLPIAATSSISTTLFYLRGYASNGFTDPIKVTFTTKPGTAPLNPGTSLSVQTHISSNLALTSGFINTHYGVNLSWLSASSSVNEIYLEVTNDGGNTWFSIAKGLNSGSLTLVGALAETYLLDGSQLRISEQPGGSRVIALSPVLTVLKSPPEAPTSLSLRLPLQTPNLQRNVTIGVQSYATNLQTIALFSDSICSNLISSKKSSGTNQDDLTVSGLSGDGIYNFYAQVIDGAGNRSQCSTSKASYQLDTQAPVVIGVENDIQPKVSKIWNWSCTDSNLPCKFRYRISLATLTNPFIDLTTYPYSDVTSASQGTGDATYYIYVQAMDLAGNVSSIVSASAILNSSVPGITFSTPPTLPVRSATSSYFDLTYSNVVSSTINLNANQISFIYSGTASGCQATAVETTSEFVRRVRFSGCQGLGTAKLKVAVAGTASSSANLQVPISESGQFDIDNLAPQITINSPSLDIINSSDTVEFTLAVNEPSTFSLTSANVSIVGDVSISGCTKTLNNGNGVIPASVRLSGCLGNGSLKINILTGAVTDSAGNLSEATGASTSTVNVDNTKPIVTVGTPSPILANKLSTILFPITVNEAVTFPSSLGIELTPTANAMGCTPSLIISNQTQATVKLLNCTGNGPLSMRVTGSLTDRAGNLSDPSAIKSGLIIDNQGPVLTIGEPSPLTGDINTTFDFSVSTGDATTVNLTSSSVLLSGAVEGCSITVIGGTTLNPTIQVSGCTGSGALSLNIDGGVSIIATDSLGNFSKTSLPSAGSVTLNNIAFNISYSAGYTALDYFDSVRGSYQLSPLSLKEPNIDSEIKLRGFKYVGTGFNHFEVALGNASQSTSVSGGWIDVGSSTSPILSSSNFHSGHTYFPSVRAVSNSGLVSSILSDSEIFIKYAPMVYSSGATDGSLNSSVNETTTHFGSFVTYSEDGLRMMVGDTGSEKVLIYKRDPGYTKSWQFIGSTNAVEDNVTTSSGTTLYGSSGVIYKVGTDKYLYIIGAPSADSNTSNSAIKGGVVVSHFENAGVLGGILQIRRPQDVRGSADQNDGGKFGYSMSLFSQLVSGINNSYLIVGAPGCNCKSTSSNGSTCSTSTGSGAVFTFLISCSGSGGVCDSNSLVPNLKYVDSANSGSGRGYGSVIKSIGTKFMVGTNANTFGGGYLYVHSSLGNSTNSLNVVGSGVTNYSLDRVALSDNGSTSSEYMVAFLDGSGKIHLGMHTSSGYEWKVQSASDNTVWTSLSLSSDLSNTGLSDYQGTTLVLGSTGSSAAIATIDWTTIDGYRIQQNLKDLYSGGTVFDAASQFADSVIINGSYITITAPGANKIYNFY